MASEEDDLAQTHTERPPTVEDFRATATAFSQLTGVLGGFSMTILVLVLTLSQESKAARDWTVGPLLVAAMAYIYGSGLLANSMNVDVFRKWESDLGKVYLFQRRVFRMGIGWFHVGNFFLPIAIIITVYQESLLVGFIASIAVALLTARIIAANILGAGIIRVQFTRKRIQDDKAEEPGNQSPTPQDESTESLPDKDVADASSQSQDATPASVPLATETEI